MGLHVCLWSFIPSHNMTHDVRRARLAKKSIRRERKHIQIPDRAGARLIDFFMTPAVNKSAEG